MNKKDLNVRFYELFNLLGHGKTEEDVETLEDFVKDIDELDKNEFKQLFDSGFVQYGKRNLPKVPGYLLLDVLLNYVDKKVPNGSQNIYQKRKSNIIKRLEDIRNKVSMVNKDEKFNPTNRLTQECIQDLLLTDGRFYFDFHDVKELDQYDYNEVDNREVLGYFGKINSRVYEVKNGKIRNVETSSFDVRGITYEEEKIKINEDYYENMQEYANDVIEEISDFFDGYFPKSFEEAELLLVQKGYSYDEYSELYTALTFRYDYLKERTMYNKSSIEFNNTRLSKYKKTKIKPARKVKEEVVRNGIFLRFDGQVNTRKSNKSPEKKLDTFVAEKNNQLMEDQTLIESITKIFRSNEKDMVKKR